MTSPFMISDRRSITEIARKRLRGYCPSRHIADNDLGGSNDFRRNSAPITIAGAFFCARILVLWRVAQEHPRVRRVPESPVRQSCATRHPSLLGGRLWWLS